MRSKLFSGAILASMTFCCATNAFAYEIKGKVASAASDTNGKYVYILPITARSMSEVIDSAMISNNSFVLSGTDKGDMVCKLIAKTDTDKRYIATFLLEKGNMDATIDEFSYVNGTPENDAFTKLMYDSYTTVAKVKELAPALKQDDAEARKKYEQIMTEHNKVKKEYIMSNPTKLTAAKIFSDMRYNLDEAEQEAVFAISNSTFQNAPGIPAMRGHLDVLKKVAPGKKFIDFEMADAEGKMHKISEYIGKGKVVLLDFWASWCGPCMREVPNIKKVYANYKSKGFEIVGISFDNKKENWMKARTDKDMNWIHLSDLKGWKSLAAPLYGVNSIPCTLLIDKDGTILQRNILGEELEAKLKELL